MRCSRLADEHYSGVIGEAMTELNGRDSRDFVCDPHGDPAAVALSPEEIGASKPARRPRRRRAGRPQSADTFDTFIVGSQSFAHAASSGGRSGRRIVQPLSSTAAWPRETHLMHASVSTCATRSKSEAHLHLVGKRCMNE